MTNSEGSPSLQSVPIPDPRQLNERIGEISAAAGPEQYRVVLVSGGPARRPQVLKDIGIHASDVPAAIHQACHVAWPPEAIGLILIDHAGREVFGRDNADRIQQQPR